MTSERISTSTREGVPAQELAREMDVPLLELWERLGSTNDRALELAADGALRGSVVLAEEQTAGRGRRRSSWVSDRGAGLWMSLVLDPSDACPQLPLIVGVSCAEAIEEHAETVRVDVKWPNDLLVGDRKLGGILVERAGGSVVVGIGVNTAPPVDGFPEELEPLVTTLEDEAGKCLASNALARGIVRAIFDRLNQPGVVLRAIEDLKTRDALAGRPVQTEHQGAGVAVGVDSTGALLLERPDGTRVSVVSGSVRLQSGSTDS